MLNGVPQKLTTQSAALPVIGNRDRNLAGLRGVSGPNVSDHADRGRFVRGQGDICHVSVSVNARHLVEQSLARLRYRGEKTQIARAWG